MDARVRLVVIFGGRSAEHDVSCVSARHVLAAADPQRYSVEPIGITRSGSWVRADEAARALERGAAALPDHVSATGETIDPLPVLTPRDDELVVVLPVLHGPFGEDGTIQGLLEMADVPFVGSGVLGSALCMDKIKAKEVAQTHGLPQARWVGVASDRIDAALPARLGAELGRPLFVKPANLGSSVGVSKAGSDTEITAALELAASYDEWILVEEAIVGRELECALLGNAEPRASVVGEIRPGAEFYTYADKYLDGAAETIVPADIPEGVATEVRDLSVRAFTALRCDGLARVDFFWPDDDRGPLLNEVNTMPGFTPISMYPKLWQASGLTYPELIDELVRLALERHARRKGHRRLDH